MSNRHPQIAIILLLAILLTMALPSSFAKYSKTENYTLKLSKEVEEDFSPFFLASNDLNPASAQITLTKTGKYVVIAKGGDGGTGVVMDGSTYKSDILGGTGGVIATYITVKGGTKIFAYIGSAGGNAKSKVYGTGGQTLALGKGGDGSNTNSSEDGLMQDHSPYASSGGGGAATALFIEPKTNSNTLATYTRNYSNLLCVAAGGGGAASWDYWYHFPDGDWAGIVKLRTYPAGMGGSGGSNVLGDENASNTQNVFCGMDGKTFSALPGDAGKKAKKGEYIAKHGSPDTYGKGGTTSGGKGGDTVLTWSIAARDGNNYKGGNYSANDASGRGGSQYDKYYSTLYGGGGGGGYCGGGAGNGVSIDYSAGGGGGGSSYLMSSTSLVTVTTINKATMADYLAVTSEGALSVKTETITWYSLDGLNNKGSARTANFDRIYKESSLFKDGFVYIKYVGAE